MSTPFDINAWLAEASLPEVTRTVYANGTLVAQAQVLEQAILDAPDEAPDGGRFMEEPAPTKGELRAQLADVIEQLAGSGVTFRIRAITDAEREQIDAAIGPKPKDEAALERWDILCGAHMVAAQTITPAVTVEDVLAMRDKIGSAQVDSLVGAAIYVSNLNTADAPFWRARSGSAHR